MINTLGSRSGGSSVMAKLLPILAPIVLNLLAGKFLGKGQSQTAPEQTTTSSGGLDDLIGSATGGDGAGGIGDLLGGLLGGGGGSGGSADVIGDLLGGLLGGGTKT